jgi:hypothetical protein
MSFPLSARPSDDLTQCAVILAGTPLLTKLAEKADHAELTRRGISQQQEKKTLVTPDRRKNPDMKKSNCVHIVFSSIGVVRMDTMWKIGCERNENCSKKRGQNVAIMSPSWM